MSNYQQKTKLGPENEKYDDLASALFVLHAKEKRGFQNVPRQERDYWRALAASADGYPTNRIINTVATY